MPERHFLGLNLTKVHKQTCASYMHLCTSKAHPDPALGLTTGADTSANTRHHAGLLQLWDSLGHVPRPEGRWVRCRRQTADCQRRCAGCWDSLCWHPLLHHHSCPAEPRMWLASSLSGWHPYFCARWGPALAQAMHATCGKGRAHSSCLSRSHVGLVGAQGAPACRACIRLGQAARTPGAGPPC